MEDEVSKIEACNFSEIGPFVSSVNFISPIYTSSLGPYAFENVLTTQTISGEPYETPDGTESGALNFRRDTAPPTDTAIEAAYDCYKSHACTIESSSYESRLRDAWTSVLKTCLNVSSFEFHTPDLIPSRQRFNPKILISPKSSVEGFNLSNNELLESLASRVQGLLRVGIGCILWAGLHVQNLTLGPMIIRGGDMFSRGYLPATDVEQGVSWSSGTDLGMLNRCRHGVKSLEIDHGIMNGAYTKCQLEPCSRFPALRRLSLSNIHILVDDLAADLSKFLQLEDLEIKYCRAVSRYITQDGSYKMVFDAIRRNPRVLHVKFLDRGLKEFPKVLVGIEMKTDDPESFKSTVYGPDTDQSKNLNEALYRYLSNQIDWNPMLEARFLPI